MGEAVNVDRFELDGVRYCADSYVSVNPGRSAQFPLTGDVRHHRVWRDAPFDDDGRTCNRGAMWVTQ
jgi:hypothetical protein